MDDKVSYQPVHFTSNEVKLEILAVNGWNLEVDKVSDGYSHVLMAIYSHVHTTLM